MWLLLLLCPVGAVAQNGFMQLNLNSISIEKEYDANGYEMHPFRMVDSERSSIVSLPYHGIAQGYDEAAIMDEFNRQFFPVHGNDIRCVKVSGVNTVHPESSRGLVYIKMEPVEPVFASIYHNILSFFSISSQTTAIISHYQNPDYHFTYSLEYSYTSGNNIDLQITGPFLIENLPYSLRKVVPGKDSYLWPVAAVVDANVPFDGTSMPSMVVSLPATSFECGNYYALTFAYDPLTVVICSNMVHIDTVGVSLELETFNVAGTWLNSGHTSFNITLDGSQFGIEYALVLVRETENGPVLDTEVARMNGTGQPITFANQTRKGIYSVLAIQPNDMRTVMSGLAEMYDPPLVLTTYSISGGGEIASGSSGTVTLSGRQSGVTYRLYLNNTLLNNTLPTSDNSFTGLTQYGKYRVKATCQSQEAWMTGEVGIWPKITRSTVAGGGTVYNNTAVTITIPSSQTILTYKLLKEGIVVQQKQGTGGALSFNVTEPGTYTITAGLQDYYVQMIGSVTVAAISGNDGYAESFVLPPAPESSALIRSITNPAAIWCGGTQIVVPLHQAVSRSIAVDMALHYQSSGNKVHDISGSAGLGWRFSAGGRITRIVRGLPDEFSDASGDLEQGTALTNWSNEQFDSWQNGQWDGESDIYFFEFGDRKGVFLFSHLGYHIPFPYQSLKIEPYDTGFFCIIDESGYRYTFGRTAKDVTVAKKDGQNLFADPYTSTWYLEKIQSPSGDVMEFDYYRDNNISHGFTERYFQCRFPSATTLHESGLLTPEYDLLHTQYCGNLKSISWRGGKVECLYSAQTGGSPLKKLNEIRIYGIQGRYRYSLFMNYENFAGTATWRPLKLLSVERRSATERLSVARFDYYETGGLPRFDSPDVDHWGYYNRANNAIHRPTFVYNGKTHAGANRAPVLDAVRSGMLKRIYSPYGGFTEYTYELNTTANGTAGGLRIASIRQATDDADSGQTTRFRYLKAGTNTSSGQSFRAVGSYAYGASSGYALVASRNRYELWDINGFTTGYSRVEEQLPNGSSRVYNYDFRGVVGLDVRNFPSYSTAQQNEIFFPSLSRFGEQGLLTSCVSYDTAGNEVERESYTYPADSRHVVPVTANLPLQFYDLSSGVMRRFIGRYTLISRDVMPVSVTISGIDTPNQTATYTRDSETLLPLEVVTTTAAGDTYRTQTRYPFQFNVNTATTSASDAYAVRIMREDHALNVPIEEIVWKNNKVVGGMLNTYKVIRTENSAKSVVPASVRELKLTASLSSFAPASFASNGTLSYNAAYKPVMWFDRYDQWGNLLQCHEQDGPYKSFIYEYDHSIATAEIVADGPAGSFYTSFEDDPLAVAVKSKTGWKARKGPIEISIDNFVSGTEYLVTWWGSLNGGSTWEPNRYTTRQASVIIGSEAHYVDEVSIIPINAAIITTTWSPGIGKTSESDGNGHTTYYEYDSFGRPNGIRNNSRQRTHSYHY